MTRSNKASAVIAIDARKYGPRDSGVGRYTASLMDALSRQKGDEVFVRLIDSRDDAAFEIDNTGRIRTVPLNAPYHSLRAFWGLPKVLRDQGAALFHSHNYHVPPFLPCPVILTVHDLTPLHHPPRLTAQIGKPLLWLLFHMAVAKARRVIVPSESTRADLRIGLKVDVDKICVIPQGVGQQFRTTDDEEVGRVRRRYHLPEQFVLYVGRWRPHKNIPNMLRAFRRVTQQTEGKNLYLVVVGTYDPTGAKSFRDADDELTRLIHFTGFVDDEDLPSVYTAAAALIAPSPAEGFGLTALEAMACGTPVVAAKRGALPEVCGDAALMVDPWSTNEMSEAIASVITDKVLARCLGDRGRARATRFTWDRTAQQTLAMYREVISGEAASGKEQRAQ